MIHENDWLRTGLAVFGAIIGAITGGATLARVVLAHQMTKIQLAVIEKVGEKFVSKEIVEVHLATIARRLERIEAHIDQIRRANGDTR